MLLAVLVLTLTAGSSCVAGSDPSLVNSWGASSQLSSSMQQRPEDYINEYDALDTAFLEMEDLLDELAAAIAEAKDATISCGDITLEIIEAMTEDDEDAALILIPEGEEILELAGPVYDRLLDAIDAVEIQLEEINAITSILDDAGLDTSSFGTGNAADLVAEGKTTASDLLTAMTTLEEILGDARSFFGIMELADTIVSQNDSTYGDGNDILFVAWGNDARYVRHTQAIDVIDLYVSVAGNNLRYQWYANTNNSNTGGTPISGATNRTYKPLTQDLGITYYYCVVSAPGGYSVPSPPISVEVFASQAALNLRITRQPEGRLYMQGDTVSEESSLFIEATGENVGYQWYAGSSTDPNATLIPDATQNRFAPPTDQVGEFYYFCKVSGAPGQNPLTSNTIKVQVLPYLVITSQPQGAQYTQGATAAPLTMAAEGENLSYQWYIDSGIPTVANTPIEGATAASYTPPTNTLGTVRYFCEVSSIANNQRNVLTTQPATVTVVAPTLTASAATAVVNTPVTYTYNLGVAQAGVDVQFAFPEGIASVVNGGPDPVSTYSGSTDSSGQITFQVEVRGLDDASISYPVTATNPFGIATTATITVTQA